MDRAELRELRAEWKELSQYPDQPRRNGRSEAARMLHTGDCWGRQRPQWKPWPAELPPSRISMARWLPGWTCWRNETR